MITQAPPHLIELLERAGMLAGRQLAEVADWLDAPVPQDQRRAKGWVGQLIERVLGAQAGSRAVPDFPHLGLELKTIPVGKSGKPAESTFVCTVELAEIADIEWKQSRVYSKLRSVLWVPIQSDARIPLGQRLIGTPLHWQPNQEELRLLQADWEELTLWMARGRTSELTAHVGQALQVRPKARRGSSQRRAFDDDGARTSEQPKGFYLRPSFTGRILQNHFRDENPRQNTPGKADGDDSLSEEP